MAKKHESENAFNATLAARLTGGAIGAVPPQTTVTGAMHMTAAPSGPSKSLEALLEGEPPASEPFSALSQKPVTAAYTEQSRDTIVRIPVQQVIDSPWQPRERYDETELQALGQAMKDRGQDEPIKVRQMPSGHYQLIYGHRRIRAARLIGWADIKATVVKIGDKDAEVATLVSNESQVTLSDWERARAYKQALDHELAKDQKDVGRLFSCSQSRVSQCLALYKLPDAILQLLDKYPALIKYRHAKVVLELVKDHPSGLDAIVKAVESLIDQPDLEPLELRIQVERALAPKRARPKNLEPRTITDKNGSSAFSVRVSERQIVINIEEGVDPEMATKRTLAALREYAQTIELPDKESSLKSMT
ncbi:ParB/RepB/Spo0J family partition protein [Massilia sp. DWR3-1-1]|uniref:ParB/RepB/Spo0J family partition protein n=1 Tax=Massilia sp. DWR3-1-1 TaxID=2804559 RepID=UPI003CEA6ADD